MKEVRVGTQGRDPEAGADAETIEECCLLAGSHCILIAPAY